jgi:hypothetical protein
MLQKRFEVSVPYLRPPAIGRHGLAVKTTARHTNFLSLLERAARLELAASALGLRRSVLLSYALIRGVTGENRTLVDWVTASRLNHSATVTKNNSRKRCNTFAAREY